MGTVRVRAVTAVPGLGVGEVGDLEDSDPILGAIAEGRLVEVDELGDTPDEELRGEALTAALRDAGLPLSGSVEEKRGRLAEHRGQTSPEE
jgi:hypothetical protein